MKINYCNYCKAEVDIYEETLLGQDYVSCSSCGAVIAKVDYDWKLPLDNSDTDTVH